MKRKEQTMQYFTHDGRLLSEREALDERGIMRDGVICRTRLTMRDGVQHRPGFASTGTTFNDWVGRDAKREAYNDYIRDLESAYKTKPARADAAGDDLEEDDDDEIPCPQCEGSGEVGRGVVCPRCYGEGFLPGDDAMTQSATRSERENADKRTVAQKMRDHKANMERIYQDHARSLSEAWRKG
jgi:hypothetical protein